MILATIELKSAVSKSRDKVQATIEIGNVGGTPSRGTYRYTIKGKDGRELHTGTIDGFPRKRGLAVDLLGLVLLDARGSKWLKL